MNRRQYIYSFVALFVAALLTACHDAAEDANVMSGRIGKLSVIASIGNSGHTAITRADLLDRVPKEGVGSIRRDDLWSYWKFSSDDNDGDGNPDRIGFFSQRGNTETGEGFDNAYMTYEVFGEDKNNGVFTSDVNVDFSRFSAETSYFYFPYDENAYNTGIELRRKDPREGHGGDTLKCVDFLRLDGFLTNGGKNDGALYGEFWHGFSELIIMRGNGFDNPIDGTGKENYTIKVYLKQPYTHLLIKPKTVGGKWTCVPELIYEESKAKNSAAANSKGEVDYHVWEAWKGADFRVEKKTEGSNDVTEVYRESWYVLLPTWGEGDKRTEVDYIELYDNEGTLQRVSALKLSNDKKDIKDPDNYTKFLTASWRYPFEISMQELVPTVNPFPIVPWEDEETIIDSRECGINNLNDFKAWIQAYNTYLADNRPEDETQINELLKYGDKVTGTDGRVKYWHFYLRADNLDLSAYTYSPINELQDILDGESYTRVGAVFQNCKVTGLTQPFIKTLKGPNAKVENFDFQGAIINTQSATAPIGVIASSITGGGVVDKCNVINGRITSGGPVGMVAGSIDGGTSKISNCNMSGFLFGTETQHRIVGTLSNGAVLEGNNAASVIFND